ncbi:MORC family CW-type zinc finger protein 3 [Seriola lalandi dorsalis]|uniref:MORC family CW-type zinc finger protein 3 n=1 Tax=Seriola lalandi dorsalis TaxID=1841481 RepID=UPI000C6FCB61|nr:MORC family CW-type zinc finger protein 3 [Seriola lalandi dorsalis]
MATAQTDRGVPLSTLCPKFLHTNSTSHTGPFSAIAELIDNAYDPDVSAKQFWIDKTVVKQEQCLSFMDNGNGLDHEAMHKMLSFGYSDKTAVNGQAPIGIYGNGFKSGSMRLGKDVIVFSKSNSTSCVGMLSQTYLKKIDAKQIIVPIVCFEPTKTGKLSVKEEHKTCLQDILLHSPFKSQAELLTELDAITPPWSTGKTGTRIIIWNLRRTSTDALEFDFAKDQYDIRIPSDIYEAMSDTTQQVTSYIPQSVYSLRAYSSVLYLKPRMQIIIRGQKVKSQLIAKSLASVRKDHYKPIFLTKRVPIIFGYNTKSKDHYGIMMYHKNRLIKAYERVGCQLKANFQGVGVIGIIECDFLDPTHNKQSFNETDKYRKTMNSLGIKLEEYWKEIRYRWSKENPNSTTPVEDAMKRPDQNWVQCDDCLRWRKLPDGIDCRKLPNKWFCRMNPDPQFRSCQVEEEPEDSDDERPSYCKTYKQQEKEDKKQQKKKKEKDEEDRRRQEEQRLANLARQNELLKRNQEDLKRRLHQTTVHVNSPATVHSPTTPTTPRSRLNTESRQGGAARAESSPLRSSTISQAACSPSSSNGLPVISNVCSLAAGPVRGKRTQPATPQRTPKRLRVNGFRRHVSDAPSSVDVSPLRSPSHQPVPVVDGDDDDTDDDIVILENASTPKPKKPSFDVTKVKKEKEPSDAAMDVATAGPSNTGSAAVGTSPSPAPPPEMTNTTTQTEVHKVKEEEESQNEAEGREDTEQSTSNTNGNKQSSHADIGVCDVEQRVIKQESEGDTQNGTLQKGMRRHLESDEAAGPSRVDASDRQYSPHHHPSITEVQEQQDQLLELMQATAQERDQFKEQVDKLTCQLQDMQSRLSQVNVKKECSHQANQVEETEETQGGNDYKSLFEKAKQKVDELIKDKDALLAAAETKHFNGHGLENDLDDIALQVDCLIREVDQRNKENDELHSQLDSLTEEKANLAAQCEELRLSLEQQREDAQEGGAAAQATSDSSVQTDPEEAEGTAASGAESSSDTFRSLIELRQNIGRLLITYVPALDLGQVNYECNVVDEILEQVLSTMEYVEAERRGDEARN